MKLDKATIRALNMRHRKLKAWGRLQGYGFHFTGWREDECSGDIIITAQQPLSGYTQPDLDILFGAKDDS